MRCHIRLLRHETTILKLSFKPFEFSLRGSHRLSSNSRILSPPSGTCPSLIFWLFLQDLLPLVTKGATTVYHLSSQLNSGVARTFTTPHHDVSMRCTSCSPLRLLPHISNSPSNSFSISNKLRCVPGCAAFSTSHAFVLSALVIALFQPVLSAFPVLPH